MYLRKTVDSLFKDGGLKDFIWLSVGLTGMLTFARVEMVDWPSLLIFLVMLLSGMVYRFLTVEKGVTRYETAITHSTVTNYVLSKNTIVISYITLLMCLVLLISGLFIPTGFDLNFLLEIYCCTFFVVGTENIILIFHHKPITSLSEKGKADTLEHIQVSLKWYLNCLPTFTNITLFSILFFGFGIKPSIYLSTGYLTSCIMLFIMFKKISLKA